MQMERDIVDLKASEPGLSLGEMVKRLGTNKMKVRRTFERNTP
jgi:hypothetical protein